jgi:hypothetical protein
MPFLPALERCVEWLVALLARHNHPAAARKVLAAAAAKLRFRVPCEPLPVAMNAHAKVPSVRFFAIACLGSQRVYRSAASFATLWNRASFDRQHQLLLAIKTHDISAHGINLLVPCSMRFVSNLLPLLSPRLPTVARQASGLAIAHVVPFAALADGNNVIGVHVSTVGHTPTVDALPVALVQHSLTPRLVGLRAVASSSCVRPG